MVGTLSHLPYKKVESRETLHLPTLSIVCEGSRRLRLVRTPVNNGLKTICRTGPTVLLKRDGSRLYLLAQSCGEISTVRVVRLPCGVAIVVLDGVAVLVLDDATTMWEQ